MTRNKAVKKLNKNGFTLTEMLVTLLITCILLAIGLVGVLQYSKSLKLTEMDNTAKEIFLAAQNHLTTADADGTLDKYRGASEDDGTLNHVSPAAGTLIKAKPSDVGNIMWPEPNDRYYYVVSGADSLSGSILKDMLPFGAIDEEVRTEGHYIIEYDIKTGTMYGVFYSKAGFTYDDVLALDAVGGRMNTKDGKAARKNFRKDIIGYYGGAMSKNLVGTDSKDLMMTVENKDRLRILLEDPNYYIKPTEDSSMAQTEITLYITGLTSSKTEKFPLKLEHSDSPLTAPKKAAGAEDWWNVTGLSADGNVRYEITLDDITKDGGHFADICPDLIPGEDIIIRAVCESKTAALKFKEVRDSTNSLFASVSGVVDELGQSVPDTAGIYYLRHLENLDPAVSKLPQLPITDKNLVHKAIQFKPLDYKASEVFGSGNYAIYSYRTSANIPAQSLASNSYYGIYNPRLTEYNGNARSISNVKITGTDCGIFRKIAQDEPMEIKNLSLNDFHVDASGNGGALAGTVSNGAKVTVKQVNVTNKTGSVTGGANAGGLIGSVSSQTEIDTCLVSGSVSASGNAGGVVGNAGDVVGNAGGVVGYLGGGSKATGSACVGIVSETSYDASKFSVNSGDKAGGLIGEAGNSSTVENCTANIKVNGKNSSGGLIGIMGGGSTVQNSYSAGFTVKGEYKDYNVEGGNAGGLIGNLSGTSSSAIKNCYSTCSAAGTIAGGLIGSESSTNTYENCYATGLVGGTTKGTFMGFSKSSANNFSNCSYLYAINAAEVKAAGNNGGCGAVEQHYIDMPKLSIGVFSKSVPADNSLEKFPFATVNKTGLSNLESNTYAGIHYGDWPKEKSMENIDKFGACTFAYREVIDGKTYWHVLTVYEDTVSHEWDVGWYDDLPVDDKKCIDDNPTNEYSYGALLAPGQDLSNMFTGDINKYVTYVDDFKGYKYYKFNNLNEFVKYAADNKNEKKLQLDKNTGIIRFANWEVAGTKRTLNFYFNPYFAAAIALNPKDLDTYQIRCADQLKNIEGGYAPSYNRTCSFRQTLNIDLKDTNNFAAIGGNEGFSGTYDTETKAGGITYTHSIANFNQTSGLFGMFSNLKPKSLVSNVNLDGNIIAAGDNIQNIGSLAGRLDGTIEHCESTVSIQAMISSGNSNCNIGGLIGDASIGSAIHESRYISDKKEQFPFYVSVSALDKGKKLNVGGFIGACDGIVEESYSNTKMHLELSDNIEKSIGGFIGKLSVSGQVTKSWSEALMTYTGNKENTAVGGFIGRIAGEIPEALAGKEKTLAEDCYAVLRGDNSGNLFIGAVDADGEKLLAASACHALLMDHNGQPVYPEEGRIFGPGKAYENCYLYGESAEADSGITALKEKYNELGSFVGFDEDVWEVINSVYPTLKNE